LPWVLGAVTAIVVVAVVALLQWFLAVKPVLPSSAASHGWVITTLGAALILENLATKFWSPDPKAVSGPPLVSTASHLVGGVRFTPYQIFIIVAAVVIILGSEVLYRTRLGKTVLAVAEDREAAELRAINPGRVAMWSFAIGGGLAGLAGVLSAPLFLASTQLGPILLLKGFEAAAIGGIGSSRGALLGGYVVGIAEAYGVRVLSPGYQDLVTFLLLLVVLLIRPTGLVATGRLRSV